MSGERIVVRHSCDSAAAPSAVFALLRDSSTYPAWSDISSYRMERPGVEEPHGVGEIRVFLSWPFTVREEIVAIVPDRSMAYVLLSGLPMRDYRGETRLDPLPDGGTRITWESSFRRLATTGWFMRPFMRIVVSRLSGRLARAAERFRADQSTISGENP